MSNIQRSKNTPEEVSLIARAWAEGKEVQVRATQAGDWQDLKGAQLTNTPLFAAYFYRVKPEPRTFEFWTSPTGSIVGKIFGVLEKDYIEAGWTKIKAKEIV